MFVFTPNSGSALELHNKMRKAGHKNVSVVEDKVHMTPFEHDNNFFYWVESMQKHFDCELTEII